MVVYTVLATIQTSMSGMEHVQMNPSRMGHVLMSQFSVMESNLHMFGAGAFTYMAILAESHCAIQTYPELNRVFVSLEYHENDQTRPHIDAEVVIQQLAQVFDGSVLNRMTVIR